MSATDQRPPAVLHDHARLLLSDALPPRGGHALPGPAADNDRSRLTRDEAEHAVRAALTPLPGDAGTVHHRLAELRLAARHLPAIMTVVDQLLFDDAAAARELGRQLVRTATSVPAAAVGITLLGRLGDATDVSGVRALGTLRPLGGPAVRALDRLDRPTAAALSLALDKHPEDVQPLVDALWTGDRPAVRTALRALPATVPLSAGTARRITEATHLPDLLDRHPDDSELLAVAAHLLVRLAHSHDDPTELLAHPDAPRLYETVIARAAELPHTLDTAATLLSLALDLSSGTAVLLDWPPGRRAELLTALDALTAASAHVAYRRERDRVQRRRAMWIRRTGRHPFEHPAAPEPIRIEVVATDPVERLSLETRVLIDGRPIVPALFRDGPALTPALLLDEGRLRARPEPHEVQLAEATCTGGCCGELFVTIRRDGEHVVWENWRRTMGGRAAFDPPTHRFDAATYDAAIARAEADASWMWHARDIARLIKAALISRPELMRRWDAERGWIGTSPDEPDTVEILFWYVPGQGSGNPDRPDRPLGFRWTVKDDGSPPESQAATVLRRLAAEDPKRYAKVVAGSKGRAEELGYAWPYPN
ncbi:hypothetical protein ACFYS8_35425 [Kitasatospora sp. NPDC004615]|uniref:hypothetical protein n=1 Tax=Kitasatospora sp. NPDC004615 TaxID=3364017 RepID=UPI0036BA08F3